MKSMYDAVMNELCAVPNKRLAFIIMNMANAFAQAYSARYPHCDKTVVGVESLRKLLAYEDYQQLFDMYVDLDLHSWQFTLSRNGKYGWVNPNSGVMTVIPNFPYEAELADAVKD